MSETIHGTCSICGGAVTTPMFWGGIHPPIPTCSRCGAVKKRPHGDIVEMERKQEMRMPDGFCQKHGLPIKTSAGDCDLCLASGGKF